MEGQQSEWGKEKAHRYRNVNAFRVFILVKCSLLQANSDSQAEIAEFPTEFLEIADSPVAFIVKV